LTTEDLEEIDDIDRIHTKIEDFVKSDDFYNECRKIYSDRI